MCCIVFVGLSYFANAQNKEGNIWYFGNNAGIDFNVSPPKLLTNGAINTIEGCAVICNQYGNLMFYTDGSTVYTKNHTIMNNGTGLEGNPSSTQSGIIVPNPTKPNIYYVFSTSGFLNKGLYYSVIDTSFNSGLGKVTSKNIALMTDGTEKLNAVKHSNGTDTWVVSHQKKNNVFYAYLVGSGGVASSPIISNVGSSYTGAGGFSPGWLKFSPEGNKLVSADYFGVTELFDFNPSTGVISNAQTLLSGTNYYGVEFSASGEYLYVSKAFSFPNELVQFDMKAGSFNDIKNSKVVLSNVFNKNPGALQLAPDGKIYLAFYNFGTHLGVINEPEKKGTACDYVENGFLLSPKSSSWGLPSFNQSFFFKPSLDIKHSLPVCGSLNFSIYNSGDTQAIISSHWDFGDGTSDTGKVVYKTYAQHGSYTITNIIDVGGKNPFTDTLTKVITTKPKPIAKIVRVQQTPCFNENYFVFADSSKFINGTVYQLSRWEYSDTNTYWLFDKNIKKKYNAAGIYTVSLIMTATNGCKDTTYDSVTVLPSADALFTTNGDRCLATNKINTTNQSTVNSPGNIWGYFWQFGDGTSSTLPSPSKSFNDTGYQTMQLIAFEQNGCNDTLTKSVYINPSPKAAFGSNNKMCLKDSAVFINTSSIAQGNLTYNWLFGDGKQSTAFANKHLYVDTGIFSVKLIALSDSLCSDSTTGTITIMPTPVADFSFTEKCANKMVLFTDNTTRYNVASFANKWSFGDGNTATTTHNTQHIYASLGMYNVKLVTAATNGCRDSITKQASVNPSPKANFSINDAAQCLNVNNFDFANTSTLPIGNLNTPLWFFDTAKTGIALTNISKIYSTDGQYSIKLLIASDSGCYDSITKYVVVHPKINIKVAINDTAQCFKEHRFVFANTSAVNTAGSIAHYNWLFGDNTTDTNVVPKPKRFATDGLFSVRGIMQTDKGCLDTFATNVRVLYSPTPAFDADEICFGDSAFFDNTTPDAQVVRWWWDFGDGTGSVLQNPYRKYAATGNYEVKLVATTDRGCKDTATVYFPDLVRPRPKAYFVDSLLDSYERYSYYTFINRSYGASDFIWDFGDGTTDNSINPLKTYTDVGYFIASLSATNSWGCVDVFSKRLLVVPDADIFIPNAFTPDNGDTLNNRFRVEGIYFVREMELNIYNRWGQLVFSSDKFGAAWDGKFKGVPVPEGVYMCTVRILDLKNQLHIRKGSVTLIR